MNLFSVVFYSSVSVKYVSETKTRKKSCETYFSAKIREFALPSKMSALSRGKFDTHAWRRMIASREASQHKMAADKKD